MGAFLNQSRPRFHFTVQEAASRFGVSPQFLATAIRRGKLRSKRVMHRSWVTKSAVAAIIEDELGYQHLPWNTELTAAA